MQPGNNDNNNHNHNNNLNHNPNEYLLRHIPLNPPPLNVNLGDAHPQAPRIAANVDGINIRFLPNVFIAPATHFIRFLVRNPHVAERVIVLGHVPHPRGDVIFRLTDNQ
jgi:hypothetical protein